MPPGRSSALRTLAAMLPAPASRRLGLLTNSLATGPAPADLPQAAPAAAEAPFRVLFLGVDHPHGCAWRISMEEVGRFEIVGFVPGFGTRHPFPR